MRRPRAAEEAVVEDRDAVGSAERGCEVLETVAVEVRKRHRCPARAGAQVDELHRVPWRAADEHRNAAGRKADGDAGERADSWLLLVTGGLGWLDRASDLRKLVEHQSEGRIHRIYTQRMEKKLRADLLPLKDELGLPGTGSSR
jgi:hypothetical protein